jgi:hypothetical protein
MTGGVAGVHHERVDLDLDAFMQHGYVAVRGAADAHTVAACRERMQVDRLGRAD